jgi:hypothetical protein
MPFEITPLEILQTYAKLIHAEPHEYIKTSRKKSFPCIIRKDFESADKNETYQFYLIKHDQKTINTGKWDQIKTLILYTYTKRLAVTSEITEIKLTVPRLKEFSAEERRDISLLVKSGNIWAISNTFQLYSSPKQCKDKGALKRRQESFVRSQKRSKPNQDDESFSDYSSSSEISSNVSTPSYSDLSPLDEFCNHWLSPSNSQAFEDSEASRNYSSEAPLPFTPDANLLTFTCDFSLPVPIPNEEYLVAAQEYQLHAVSEVPIQGEEEFPNDFNWFGTSNANFESLELDFELLNTLVNV